MPPQGQRQSNKNYDSRCRERVASDQVSTLMGLIRSIVVFTVMAVTVIPVTLVIIVTAPFISHEARWWYLARPWLRWAIKVVRVVGGIAYTVEGEELLPDVTLSQRIILCPKHQSTWETFFFASRMPAPLAYVFKRELLYIPFFGWAMACLNMIPIDRSAGRDAWSKVASLGEELMNRGKWMIMFPEGTRSVRGTQGVYKTGAARLAVATGASIVPVAVTSARCWPRKSFTFIPGTIAVSIGKPIAPAPGESPAELMKKVEEWIETEMRRLDPEAYPQVQRVQTIEEREAALSQALEARAAAARAAQGGMSADEHV